jgi:hypothetical protein
MPADHRGEREARMQVILEPKHSGFSQDVPWHLHCNVRPLS